MKIGLTGSIACGKSTVSSYLRQLGFAVVDADAISHALTAPGGKALPLLREAFGDHIFDGDVLNRRALGNLVFADDSKRGQLNALLHPLIIGQVHGDLERFDVPDTLVFGDVPLLYECAMESLFDQVWVVSVSQEAQIARLMARDDLTEAEALDRIASQMPLEEKRRRANAVIHSDGTIEQTRKQVDHLISAALKSLSRP